MPKKAVNQIEKLYRKNRLRILSKKYNNPAQRVKTLAITGTNGKTTSISMLNSIIKASGQTTILSTTAGREIAGEMVNADSCQTVPSTEELQQLYQTAHDQNIDYMLLEITSHALNQFKIPKLNLEAAGFTNLSQEHLDYHKSMEDYANQKLKLFTEFKAKQIILNHDDEWFEYFTNKITSDFYSYGINSTSDFQIIKVKLFKQGSDITFKFKDELIDISIPIPGKFNVYNAILASAMAKSIGIDNKFIINGLADFEGVKGRLEWIPNNLGIDIMIDYAHTPDGIEKLLEFSKEITKGKVSIIIGSAGKRDIEKRPFMGKSAAKYADRIFVTDEEPRDEDPANIRNDIMKGIIEVGAEDKAIDIADRREAIEAAIEVSNPGDMLIVSGLGHQMEREIGSEHIPWSDIEITREILTEKQE